MSRIPNLSTIGLEISALSQGAAAGSPFETPEKIALAQRYVLANSPEYADEFPGVAPFRRGDAVAPTPPQVLPPLQPLLTHSDARSNRLLHHRNPATANRCHRRRSRPQ